MNAYQIHLNMIAEKHTQKIFNVTITTASDIETNLHNWLFPMHLPKYQAFKNILKKTFKFRKTNISNKQLFPAKYL